MEKTETTKEPIYPAGYYVKSIDKQLESLERYGLHHSFYRIDKVLLNKIKNGEIALPKGAEGWFAIPNPLRCTPSYPDFVKTDLPEALKASGFSSLKIYCAYQFEEELKLCEDSMKKISQIDSQQGCPNTLIIPAQFGSLHRNQTVQESHQEFMANEFGLWSAAVGVMLLTHYERVGNPYETHLRLNCPGDILRNTHAPYWTYSYNCKLSLDFFNIDGQQGNTVSGFIY